MGGVSFSSVETGAAYWNRIPRKNCKGSVETVEVNEDWGSQDGKDCSEGTPSPLPSKFLVFMKIAAFCVQNREAMGLTGKIFLTKDLGWIFWDWTGALAGR
jgi:hypothetical protein